VRTASPRPDELLRLLRVHKSAEDALRLYVLGLLDGLGIPRERFKGIDDETGELILADEAPEGADDDADY